MRSKKRIAVLPRIERRGPTCGEEDRIDYTQETEDGPQIRFDEIEGGHLRLRIIVTTRRNDERRFLSNEQSLRTSGAIGKGLAHTGDLIDSQLQHRGHAKVMHRDAYDVFVGPL